MKILYYTLFLYFATWNLIHSQTKGVYTEDDYIRGSITKERAWWDVQHYNLKFKIFPNKKFISGSNTITYTVLSSKDRMQIDLQPPMQITKIKQNQTLLQFSRKGNTYYIDFNKKQKKGTTQEITIYFEGNPPISEQPPWDAGFTWKKDILNNHFIATSCQGEGASVWWPCKDHMYDEPEKGATISLTIPKDLIGVSNGRLTAIDTLNSFSKTFVWNVTNPINNYGINANIGKYVLFSETYNGEKGALDCQYYVLEENLEKAKKQFKQVQKVLKAFEHWFGPYPFYEDSYKLVEVPYLGMEHQSSVTYGNQFKNGYLGHDLSNTGWGLKFDYIIVHETGHEWFANNITYKDIADMWVHESFTTYSEALYLEYYFGKKAANEYVIGLRKNIKNEEPIIGTYHVNEQGSTDIYYKGANIIHTLRQVIDNDDKFRAILRGLNQEFYHQTVTTKQIEKYISKKSNINFSSFFDVYLRTSKVPILEYKIKENGIKYRWKNSENNLKVPIKVYYNQTEKWIKPSILWKTLKIENTDSFSLNTNFYIKLERV